MFKKAIPLVIISGIALAGCGNNETVPKNNETPMEDNTRNWAPDVNDEQTGPNMDGLNNGDNDGTGIMNGNDNNGNNDGTGIMNGNDNNGTNENGNTGTGNGVIQEGTTNEGTMENDLNRKNKDNNNNR